MSGKGEVTHYLNQNDSTSSASKQVIKEGPPVSSQEAVAIATELQKLDRQALALDVPRANKYQTVCRDTYLGICIGKHTVLVSIGVEGYLTEALLRHNEESTPNESVTIQDDTFTINPSHHETKIAIIREMENVLTGSTPANARRMLSAWAELRKEREDIRARDYEQVKQKAADEYRSAQQDFERMVAQKQQARQLAIMGIGLALVAVVLLGLVLAVLAIERHTRLLELRDSTVPSSSS